MNLLPHYMYIAKPLNLTLLSVDANSDIVDGVFMPENGSRTEIQCRALVNPMASVEFASQLASSGNLSHRIMDSGLVLVSKNISVTRFMGHAEEVFRCVVTNTRDPSLSSSSQATLKVVVHGQWAEWGRWDKCSKTCGGGSRARDRTCSNPAPSDGGRPCDGSPNNYDTCANVIPCDYVVRMSDFLWSHSTDVVEFKSLLIYAALVACVTGIFIYMWYMRVSYIKDSREYYRATTAEFADLIKKLTTILDEQRARAYEGEDGGEVHEEGRDIVQHITEYGDTTDEIKDIEGFFKVIHKVIDKKEERRPRDVEFAESKSLDLSSCKRDVAILKHDLGKILLVQSHSSNDKEKISNALGTYHTSVNELKEQGIRPDRRLVRKTEKLIFGLSLKQLLEEAQQSEDVEAMHRILEVAEARKLQQHFEDFEVTVQRAQALKVLDSLKSSIVKMNRSQMSELRGYKHPPALVHDVLVATLLLLGHGENETRDWFSCQHLCQTVSTPSTPGLYRQITTFKTESVHPQIAARVIEILDKHCLEEIKTVSLPAAAFYLWTRGVATYKLDFCRQKVLPATLQQQSFLLSGDASTRRRSSVTPRNRRTTVSPETSAGDKTQPKCISASEDENFPQREIPENELQDDQCIQIAQTLEQRISQ